MYYVKKARYMEKVYETRAIAAAPCDVLYKGRFATPVNRPPLQL